VTATRKTAAILVADVVDYSRLAGVDEERTLARLRGCGVLRRPVEARPRQQLNSIETLLSYGSIHLGNGIENLD
jgi:hypothetical protein